jgi:hypothetical protein
LTSDGKFIETISVACNSAKYVKMDGEYFLVTKLWSNKKRKCV